MSGFLSEYRRYVEYKKVALSCRQWIQLHAPEGALFEAHTSWETAREHVGLRHNVQDSFSNSPEYILCAPTTRPDLISHKTDHWLALLTTPTFEFWERDRWAADEKPLRFGFTQGERSELSATARHIMRAYMVSGERPPLPALLSHTRYRERCDVDLALWIDGHEHGSQIGIGRSFAENFLDAACRVIRDSRFAPATIEEIERAQIEITLLLDLALPVFPQNAESEAIPHNRGHAVILDGVRRGIYIPALLNGNNQMRSYQELLHSLARRKAQLSDNETRRASFVTFPIINWIAGPSDRPILLEGTIPAKASVSSIEPVLAAAASWLCNSTESNGYMPPILSPLYANPKHLDLVRIVLNAIALNAYGTRTGDVTIIETAARIAQYARDQVGTRDIYPDAYISYYLGQYYVSTGRLDEAVNILAQYKNVANTFCVLHRARLQCMLQQEGVPVPDFESVVTNLVEQFMHARDRGDVPLGMWAELMTLTHDTKHPAHQEICDWFVALQCENGSFPNTLQDPFPYVRGTGKIAEALAYTGAYTTAVQRALSWSARLQYTEDTVYHIPKELRPRFLGAFRHDALNRDAWTDAAAHVLLAGVRLLESDTTAS